MKKISRLPREQAAGVDDGLQDVDQAPGVDGDVEGHRSPSGDRLNRLPGTGGDFRRPSGGGEIDAEDDVKGHVS